MLNQSNSSPWTPSEQAAWAPPEAITVSEWAERYRILPKQSAIPGLWSNRLGPYAVGVMDAFNDRLVERITIMASVQSMKTESVYNMLGYAICQDPAPALVVMPTLKTLKRVNKRLRDMLWASPELSLHLTSNPDDLKIEMIGLKRMEIYFATAGSSADLQNVEARYVILDETDEYPPGSEDGDPVEMAIDRSTTYWNRKIIDLSRPTVEEGHIWKEFQRSDKRRYWVPCPHCGGYQVLSFWQVKHKGGKRAEWPEEKQIPEYIKAERPARYECRYCQVEIDDKDKPEMLARGKWVPDGHHIAVNGDMAPVPVNSHVGFTWSVLYSPFRTFSEVAAQYFATKDDPDKYRIFVNQWLAEPWKDVIQSQEASAVLSLRTKRPPRLAPAGTIALTAGIDSQKNGFWVVIRAWLLAPKLTSHLLRYGFVANFDDLETWIFEDQYQVEDAHHALPVWRAGIDIGGGSEGPWESSITDKVYDWLRTRSRGLVFGVKGAAHKISGGRKMSLSIIDRMPKGGLIPGGIRLWHLDTNAFKDLLWARITAGQFHLHADVDEIYAAHLVAEVKERDRRGKELWVQQGRKPNHLLDCEVYAAAMADPECWGGVMVLPRPGQSAVQKKEVGTKPNWLQTQGHDWLRR